MPSARGKYLLFLGPEDYPPRKQKFVVDSFRAPRWLLEKGHAMARAEDLSFSQFMRRAIRRQLTEAGIAIEADQVAASIRSVGTQRSSAR